MRFVIFTIAVMLMALSTVSAGASAGSEGEFLAAVAKAGKTVETGPSKVAQKSYNAIKMDFPETAGADFDIFVKAEIYYCKDKFVKAVRNYNKMLTEFPNSLLSDAALDREFVIAKAYLAGRKKTVLGFIKMKGYAEGIKIMEKIAERVGLDTEMGIDASVAVAKNYEQRKKFNEAFLKWWEISLEWETGPVGGDALLGMARNKHAIYNKPPEHKRPYYDASCLNSAKSYYERFKLLYPKDAKEIGVDEILSEIDEQLAYKQLCIGRYYQRTGHIQSANLYFDMVMKDWPDSEAAGEAKELLSKK
jgi:outer membrane protein assembly factor BamD (BamD/ComL family)